MEFTDNAYAAIAATTLLLLAGIATGGMILYAVCAALILLIAIDCLRLWLMARSAKQRLAVSRSLSDNNIFPGSKTMLTIKFTYPGGPLSKLHIVQTLDATILAYPLPATVQLSRGSNRELSTVLTPTKCGNFILAPLTVEMGSLLFRKALRMGGEEKLTVIPAIGISAPVNEPRPTHHQHGRPGDALDRVIEKHGGVDFSGLKRYEVGDDIRRVDWSISNRADVLVIKEYEDERPLPTFFLIDVDPSMAPEGARSNLESAVDLTTKLVDRMLLDNEGLGLIGFSRSDIVKFIQNGTGRHQAEAFRNALLSIKPEGTDVHSSPPVSVSLQEMYVMGLAFDDAAGHEVLGPILEETLARHQANIRDDGFSRAIVKAIKSSKTPCSIIVMTNLSMGMASLLNGIRLVKYYGHSISVILMPNVWHVKKS
jgi:uncharacterized protein (DUF58 family)